METLAKCEVRFTTWITVNHIYKITVRNEKPIVYKTSKARKFQRTIAKLINQNANFEKIEKIKENGHGDIIVLLKYYFPDKRRRDTNNLIKIIADGIEKGIGIDDSRFLIREMSKKIDRENPRIEIEITYQDNQEEQD